MAQRCAGAEKPPFLRVQAAPEHCKKLPYILPTEKHIKFNHPCTVGNVYTLRIMGSQNWWELEIPGPCYTGSNPSFLEGPMILRVGQFVRKQTIGNLRVSRALKLDPKTSPLPKLPPPRGSAMNLPGWVC